MKRAMPLSIFIYLLFSCGALSAAEPIKFDLGGYANIWMGYAANQRDKDYSGNAAYGLNFPLFNAAVDGQLRPAPVAIREDVEGDVSGSTRLDNGMRVMAEVDLSPTVDKLTASAANKLVRRAYAALSGNFGSLSGGERENIGQILHHSAPDLSGIGGQDGNWWRWLLTPTGHRGLQRTYLGDDLNSAKVMYLSPAFEGLSAGISYTPSVDAAAARTIPSSPSGALYLYAASYHRDFSAGGVLRADLAFGQENSGLQAYQSGISVSYAGLTLGGSFLRRDVASRQPALKDSLAQGIAWDAGLSYSLGAYSLAINGFAERAAKGNLTNAGAMAGLGPWAAIGSTGFAHDRDLVTAVEGSRKLSSATSLNATVFRVAYHDAFGNAAEKNQGWGLLSGLALKF